jgi:peptidyl-dipeptidase A
MNRLMMVALQKIAFLPFALMLDTWRWRVFSGEITPDSYNTQWWALVKQYQGITSPVGRDESSFDPGGIK